MSAALPLRQPLPRELLAREARDAFPDSADEASTAEPSSCSPSSATSGCGGPPSPSASQLLRSVAVHGPHADARLAGLVRQARSLSEGAFDEDCLQEVTRKSGWKLSVLASEDLTVLCGFVVAKATHGVLSIAKLAVPEEFRGRGFGRLIMGELMRAARKQGDVFDVSLSSLSTAVAFYQRLGFKAFRGLKLSSQQELVEGQVYMERKLRPRRK